jgi:PAS domain S-box-containing protein
MSSSPALDGLTLSHLRGLLELLRLQQREHEAATLFERIAAILGESLGFRAVVVNLYRPRWDDFEVVAVHGSADARELLLGTTSGLSAWTPMLHERFRRGDVYFIPHDELDWNELGPVYLPPLVPAEGRNAWHPEDGLIAPMLGSDGALLGILSAESGDVPGDDELELLGTVAAHVGLAIEAAQATAAAARDRASLVNLLEVSARLTELETVESVLGAVTRGIQQALGFEKVVAATSDGAGGFVPRGAAGWSLTDAALDFSISSSEARTLLDPEYEIEGCFLLPRELAVTYAPRHSSYASVRNGLGPRAWNRHWLIVPLLDSRGEFLGFIWADDPEDSLLPSRERLQALRIFANQASAALRAAADLETLTRRNAELASLHRTTLDLLDRLELDSVLESIVDSARALLGTNHGYLYLVDEQEASLQLRVRLGMFERWPASVIMRGDGVAGRVWNTGASLAVDDYACWEGRLPQYDEAGFHALLGVPLRAGGVVKGVLGLAYDEPARSFGSGEVALLERFAQLASLALENAGLYTELQRSEEMYRRVLENSHDLISLIDLEGRITYANAAHEQVLGYSIDELVGMPAAELADPDDPPMALSGKEPSLPLRRIRCKNGSWALLEGSTVVLRDAAGEPELTLAFARDVSERERIAEQLRQAQKMESIGRLAGGIAHDFNNLLTAIGGYAELGALELETGEIEPARESIVQIQRASGRAAELTSQLLAFSRKQVLHTRELDLNEVISGMTSMLARLLGDDIVLASELDAELEPVLADPSQIEQVLLNLAINARDAMPEGGILSIRTANAELTSEDAHELEPGSYVTLSVGDTGVGMEPALAERIFEPFFTTKNVGEGTGLGLATVHGIVSQSGGSIRVQSEPGCGTSLTVCLPRAA